MKDIYSHVVPQQAPKKGSKFTKWLGRSVLHGLGWKITGEFPKESKLVFIGAPHTSNWDFIVAMASIEAVGIKANWMMKKEAFFWPLGGLFKKMGGVPIDRRAKSDITQQMADWFNAVEKGYLGITPEGTRSSVNAYKKGYLRIAYSAKVPVFLVAINGETKEIVLDKIWDLTFDTDVDNRKIKAYYDKTYQGIRSPKIK